MRSLYLLILILLLFSGARAQEFHYSFRNYKAVDGLPQSQVRAIVEDNNGYLWVGTEGGGLARFDGRTFKVYTTLDGLQSNSVHHLLFDRKHQLWIIHPRGITKFDGKSFRKYEQPGPKTSTTRLRKIYEYQDTLFFISSPGHIGKIWNDSVHYWSEPVFARKDGQREQLIALARKGSDGSLYLVINQQSLYIRHQNESYRVYFNDHFRYAKSGFEYKGKFVLQTDQGFWSLDRGTRSLVKESIPITNRVMYYDSLHDVFWTATETALMKEKWDGTTVKTQVVKEDISFSEIVVDSEGNTWLGSDGSGLFKYFVQDFDRCSSDNLTYIMAIHQDTDGATWIGSMSKGLWKINKGKVSTYPIPGERDRKAVYSIKTSPDGSLYVATSVGLGKYNRSTDRFDWSVFPKSNLKRGVINLDFKTDDEYFVATIGGGVSHVNGETVNNYSVDNGLNSNFVMSLFYSQYYKCLFTGDEFGLTRITDGRIEPEKIDGLENTTVLGIRDYRDTLLLISTGGSGLIIYNPATKWKKFIGSRDGLASDFIYFTAVDEKDYFWVGTEKGITRIKLDTDLNVFERLHYDYDNGLTGVETNQNAFSFSNGNKYFGLIDGLYMFNDRPMDQEKSFGLHLTGVELFYKAVPLEYTEGTSSFFNIPVNLSLPPDQNHITFHFNKVSKRFGKSIQFKFYLQGYDKTWSTPSSENKATYGNLPPGDYTFFVLSTDQNGRWEEKPLAYQFRIRIPFYAKTSFLIIAMAGVVALTILILYLRVHHRMRHIVMLERVRLSEQERVRKDIARDFHDEMGNQLTRIINYISLLKMNGTVGAAKNHGEIYTKVEQSAKYLYTGTRDFIWSIDPSNDELSKLFIHIRDFGEKLFEEKEISFRAINEVRETVKLPYGFSREANLIFKEAMTNAFKYSNAKNITFSLNRDDNGYRMCLKDDGAGFDPLKIDTSESGLKNIRERAAKIDVRLSVETVQEKGTEISIFFVNTKKQGYGIAI